jgi:nuclease S1
VDIPVDAKAFDETRDGHHANNVIDKIADFTAVLKDPKTTKDAKAEALKFVVHFVGDLHQPLHAAERNKDKGGNSRLVFFLDRPRATNLHSVWDTTILLSHKGTVRNSAYADKLNAAITDAQAAEWAKGTVTDWANESHNVAVQTVYADVAASGPPPKLDQKYVDAAGLVIDRQLQRGGVRLATILNGVFK